MKELRWSSEKNEHLKRKRGVSFDQLINARFLGVEGHPSRSNQELMIFEYRSQAWVIPYVEGEGYYFLKTAFPSRKHTKIYLKGRSK